MGCNGACNVNAAELGQMPEGFAQLQQYQVQQGQQNMAQMVGGLALNQAGGAVGIFNVPGAQGGMPGMPGPLPPDVNALDIATINRLIRMLDTFIANHMGAAAARLAAYLCKYNGFDCTTGECAVQMADGSVQLVREMPDQAKNCAVDLRYPQCTREGWRRQWGRPRVIKVAGPGGADWKIDPAVPGFFAIELVGPQSIGTIGNPWPGLSQLPGHWDIESIQVNNPGVTTMTLFMLRGAQHMWDPATAAPEMVLQYPAEAPLNNIQVKDGRCACDELEQCIPSFGDLRIGSGVLRLYVDAANIATVPSLSIMLQFCPDVHLPATLPVNCYEPKLPLVVPLVIP